MSLFAGSRKKRNNYRKKKVVQLISDSDNEDHPLNEGSDAQTVTAVPTVHEVSRKECVKVL